ncbi:unnamed protein product [Rhizoctonia solani]|uniref:F-box domain-containing protein n=1 Tax=Rhizoctonia solani TaxID=456999 RepID=A0A8H3BGG1_9AGAM|nr:unnamed protein product [Rhizoctonia solani]
MDINNAGNPRSKSALANALPSEIITHIFYIILVNAHRCLVSRMPGAPTDVTYPKLHPIDTLAHICSYWRQVALTSPLLWTHIDIALNHELSPTLVERAGLYANRAGQVPLNIHIADAGFERDQGPFRLVLADKMVPISVLNSSSPDYLRPLEFAFLDSHRATVPIRSLEIDIIVFGHFHQRQGDAIGYFLSRCQPGIFNQYIARITCVGSYDICSVLQPEDISYEGHTDRTHTINLPNQYFEALWLPVRTLRTNGLCPHWSSQAYHGLSELQIQGKTPRLIASQLMGILRASPGLRVLCLDAVVYRDSEEIEPIPLNDLERLSVATANWLAIEHEVLSTDDILDMLSPGLKPLRFSGYRGSMESYRKFACRTNIAHLYIEGNSSISLLHSINAGGYLQTLVFNALLLENDLARLIFGEDNFQEAELVCETSTATPQIETVYLISSLNLPFEGLLRFIKRYSIKRLVMCGGVLSYWGTKGVCVSDTKELIKAKLSTITTCEVQYYGFKDPMPIDLGDWK